MTIESAEQIVYDAFGRRVSKTVGGTVTQFLYDGLNPVQELSGTGGVTASILAGLNVDEYFSRTDSGGAVSFLTDALGSTIGSSSGGSIGTSYTYQPFGTSYTYQPFGATTVAGSNANPYQFTGRENDGTGLYFYRARYYSRHSRDSSPRTQLGSVATTQISTAASTMIR